MSTAPPCPFPFGLTVRHRSHQTVVGQVTGWNYSPAHDTWCVHVGTVFDLPDAWVPHTATEPAPPHPAGGDHMRRDPAPDVNNPDVNNPDIAPDAPPHGPAASTVDENDDAAGVEAAESPAGTGPVTEPRRSPRLLRGRRARTTGTGRATAETGPGWSRLPDGHRRGGVRAPGHGYDGSVFRLPTVRTSSRTAALAYPFLAQPPLTNRGTYIGTNLSSGAAFTFDPWVLYNAKRIDNPNVLVSADIGSGKTNLVCALTLRSMIFGRKIAAIDAKYDWARFADTYGGQAITVGAEGSTAVLNPLDIDVDRMRPVSDVDADGQPIDRGRLAAEKQLELMRAVLAMKLRRDIAAGLFEESALMAALEQANRSRSFRPILSDVYAALVEPDRDLATELRVTREDYFTATRELRGALHSLLQGKAGRLFNGQSTVTFDADAPIVALNLFPLLQDDENLPIAFTCASAWLEAALMSGRGNRWAVYDEAWKVLQSSPAAVKRLQQQFRLSRTFGMSNVLVLHNLSDAAAVAGDGSAASKQAAQLVSMAATRIVGKTLPDQIAATQDGLALTDTETAVIRSAGTGEFIVKIQTTAGARSYRIQVARHPAEATWWDTASGMNTPTGG